MHPRQKEWKLYLIIASIGVIIALLIDWIKKS